MKIMSCQSGSREKEKKIPISNETLTPRGNIIAIQMGS